MNCCGFDCIPADMGKITHETSSFTADYFCTPDSNRHLNQFLLMKSRDDDDGWWDEEAQHCADRNQIHMQGDSRYWNYEIPNPTPIAVIPPHNTSYLTHKNTRSLLNAYLRGTKWRDSCFCFEYIRMYDHEECNWFDRSVLPRSTWRTVKQTPESNRSDIIYYDLHSRPPYYSHWC